MAINDGTTTRSTMEKGDIKYREEVAGSPPPEVNPIGAGAEASMTWKTWVVIFVSLQNRGEDPKLTFAGVEFLFWSVILACSDDSCYAIKACRDPR